MRISLDKAKTLLVDLTGSALVDVDFRRVRSAGAVSDLGMVVMFLRCGSHGTRTWDVTVRLADFEHLVHQILGDR